MQNKSKVVISAILDMLNCILLGFLFGAVVAPTVLDWARTLID
jgi:hypothetical protein